MVTFGFYIPPLDLSVRSIAVGSSDMAQGSDGVLQNLKAEAAKRPRLAVGRPRFSPEFDGLNCANLGLSTASLRLSAVSAFGFCGMPLGPSTKMLLPLSVAVVVLAEDLKDLRVLYDVGDIPVQKIRDCGVDDDGWMNVISESVKLFMDELLQVGSNDMTQGSDSELQKLKAEAAKRPRLAVGRPRFSPEFDGLDCFEALASH
ncbi:Arginase 1 [Nymphaea thermarum]|nr:Arginase 1 [Nymphaea thermarum]